MRIKEVRLDVIYNTGNYTNKRIGLTASIESGDTITKVFRRLKADADYAFRVVSEGDEDEEGVG